jgi:nucleotide-binding universal stress UspA family protein
MVRRDTSTPALEILAAAEEQSAEMIVLGKSAKSTLVKLFIGSVAEDVLRCAKTDVLTLSGDEQL